MWAALIPKNELPKGLQGPHDDWWPWPFSRVPRAWNAWVSDKPPVVLAGHLNSDGHADIPDPGDWILTWPPYIAATTTGGHHFRFGVRYDDDPDDPLQKEVYGDGKYYTFPSVAFGKKVRR